MHPSRSRIVLFILALLLPVIAALLLVIQSLGPYEDETLFIATFYSESASSFRIVLAGLDIPLMTMPYLGALKTWFWAPLLHIFPPSLWVLRGPCLLIALSSVFFYARAAALVTGHPLPGFLLAALLLSDSEYLLVNVLDWGPVALHHLLLAACLWLIAGPRRFESHPRTRWILTGVLSGLLIFNKANAIWTLVPLYTLFVLAALRSGGLRVVAERMIWAGAGFLAGAVVLLRSVAAAGLAPILKFVQRDPDSLPQKATHLLLTLDHQSLRGWLVNSPLPEALPEHLLAGLTLLLTTGGLLLVRRQHRVAAAIAAATLLLAWLQMATLQNAGGSMHHIVLLWPLHYFLIVAGLAHRRAGRAAILVLVLLSTYQSFRTYQAVITGAPTPGWSMASRQLAGYLKQLQPAHLFLNDWGFANNLIFWSNGALQGNSAAGVFWSTALNSAAEKTLRANMADPAAIHVSLAPGRRAFGLVEEAMTRIAREQGWQRKILCIIPDESGAPMYEVYRFEASVAPTL